LLENARSARPAPAGAPGGLPEGKMRSHEFLNAARAEQGCPGASSGLTYAGNANGRAGEAPPEVRTANGTVSAEMKSARRPTRLPRDRASTSARLEPGPPSGRWPVGRGCTVPPPLVARQGRQRHGDGVVDLPCSRRLPAGRPVTRGLIATWGRGCTPLWSRGKRPASCQDREPSRTQHNPATVTSSRPAHMPSDGTAHERQDRRRHLDFLEGATASARPIMPRWHGDSLPGYGESEDTPASEPPPPAHRRRARRVASERRTVHRPSCRSAGG